MPPKNPEPRQHMWRMTSTVQIAADALKSRLQLVTGRPSLTRDQVVLVALRAAEDASDADLVGYLNAQNGVL